MKEVKCQLCSNYVDINKAIIVDDSNYYCCLECAEKDCGELTQIINLSDILFK